MTVKSLHRIKAESFVENYVSGMSFHRACSEAGVNPSKSQGETFYVYAIVRDDVDEVVYIGKGKGRRMFSHSNEVKAGRISGMKKYMGLKSLADRGISVTAYSVIEGMSESAAYRIEKILIAALRSKGLLNSSSGGMTRNDYALAECLRMLDAYGKPPQSNGGNTDQIGDIRAFLIGAVQNYIKEIKASDATGYIHNDWWDDNRGAAHMKHLKTHPELVPVPLKKPNFNIDERINT